MWGAADDALLAGFGMGDAEAATAFVRRYQARVFGLARSIVGDAALAEDVAQEAFVRAWRHAAAYDARRGSVLTWLLTITRNLAIDALRMRRSIPVDPTTLAALELHATGMGAEPGHAAELADQAGRLRRAMAGLPEQQRRALVLAGLMGRTAKEVSESENIPLGTAKTRIRAGMHKLREALAENTEEAQEGDCSTATAVEAREERRP
jgi:RNA polymerase sigma factor (sigma-70 family)